MLSDIRSVWGRDVVVVQTVEDNAVEGTMETTTNSVANNRLPGVDDVILVRPGKWGDLQHFKERMVGLHAILLECLSGGADS